MNPGRPGRLEAPTQAHQDRVLAELADILAEQKVRARQGDLKSVRELIVKSSALLRELAEAAPLTPQSQRQLSEIDKDHRQVALILAAARQEAAARLGNLRHGKGALRGYRGL
jgi:uncharacterized coiled-coil protein SlyX